MGKYADENIRIFIDESLEHLADIENELLAIEQGGANIDENLVNKVYRAAHSIKGGAGFMGLVNIKNLTHEMENVLGKIRSREIVPASPVITILLLASDALRNLLNDIDNSNDAGITEHLEALKSITDGSFDEEKCADADLQPPTEMVNLSSPRENSNDGEVTGHPEAPDSITDGSSDKKKCEDTGLQPSTAGMVNIPSPSEKCIFSVADKDISDIRKDGKYLYLVELDFTQHVEMKSETLLNVIGDMKDCGMILDSRPDITTVEHLNVDKHSDGFPFLALFATVLKPADVDKLLNSNVINIYVVTEDFTVKPVSLEPVEKLPGTGDMPAIIKEDVAEESALPDVTAPHTSADVIASEPAAPESVEEVSGDETGDMPTMVKEDVNPPTEETGDTSKTKQPQTNLRVNIKLLDSLMTLAGELVLSRNQLLQSIFRKDRRSLEISGQRIDLITSELQEAIMHTRMQPIRNIFNKYPRVVRDLAMSLDKKMDLFIEGKEVELDKSIIESLNDPMTHLIRNAADHGIESPEFRIRQGKDPVGKIYLRAYHEAGQVNIEITDDGRGIDGDRIAESAVAKGLVSEEMVRGMSPGEKVHLIFLPGFSMSDKVTELSGRGVGMDVVKTNLDGLGGIVDINSVPGKGTTIHIKLPLTLAIIPSLLVSDGNERYAIPQVNVVELLRIPPYKIRDRIEQVGDAHVVRLRDKLLPLLRLSDVLGVERTYSDPKNGTEKPDRRKTIADRRSLKMPLFFDDETTGKMPADPGIENGGNTHEKEPDRRRVSDRRYHSQSAINIVVVSTGAFKYGMIVDALHDSEEIVVKPLGRHLKECRGYAGATILGDGRVALILDAANLARMAELTFVSGSDRASEVTEKFIPPGEDKHTLLIFRNSEKGRFAVPLELVERIKKIRCSDIEIVGGSRIIRYRGSSMPLFDMGDVAQVDAFEKKEKALVIVFYVAGLDVGLLAIPPIDSVKVAYTIDDTTLRQPGILGSAVIEEQTTLIVDVIGLIEALHPEWFSVERHMKQQVGKSKSVILAEDSKFFRNQMKCAIENAGYDVIEAEDGMIAWNLLQKNAGEISLVVTDIEMPNLDGFGFTQKVKQDGRFSDLPVIAVTSLAGKEDIKKAKACGVDEYQIKLDRKKLVECINHYLN
ncbi:chemotaxis protein CheW [Desulfococcaceae bacterium HSG8]|nr:chemotaxis protein CheW [Desulfococcaceae bacterium HSG8]